jgi:hypothetical protein
MDALRQKLSGSGLNRAMVSPPGLAFPDRNHLETDGA